MKYTNTFAFLWLAMVLAGCVGWALNLVHVVHGDFQHITPLLVIQVVGIVFAPVGAVLGWIV